MWQISCALGLSQGSQTSVDVSKNKYVILFETLAGANDLKAGNFLLRAIKWTENSLTYNGDDKWCLKN